MTGIDSGRAFYAGLLEALTAVMASAKGYLRDHGPMVATLSTRIGHEMGLSKAECSELFFAAVLADMGMVGLAEDAWENPVPELPPDVRARVDRHPARSEERVKQIPHLEALAPLVRHHHEWWDGSGYPDGLRGDAIPLGSQILRIADTVTALGQWRPHRPALSSEHIIEVIERSIGVEVGSEVGATYLSLARGRDVPGYEPSAFRHEILRAAEHVLPHLVSPLSSDQLLAIVSKLIDAKDPYTGGHSRRVAVLAVAVAGQLCLDDDMKATARAGGYLHDLGKLAVPLRILTKKTHLTELEFAFIKAHPSDGAEILENIPSLQHLSAGARYHHERWDGSGYPDGLSGGDIPMVAQIIAICDAYDAMTSDRAYRDARAHPAAIAEVARSSGVHFGPKVSEAFLSVPVQVFEVVRAIPSERTRAYARRMPFYRKRSSRGAGRLSRC